MGKPYELHPEHSDQPLPWLNRFNPTLNIDRNSPAILVMMDFCHQKPLCVNSHTPATAASNVLKAAKLTDLLVNDRDGAIIGVLGRAQIREERFLQVIHDLKKPRDLIEVEEFMVPNANIGRISMRDACKASISDIVRAMRAQSEDHLYVVNNDERNQEICGLFSIDLLNQALRGNLAMDLPALSFAELEQRLVPLELN